MLDRAREHMLSARKKDDKRLWVSTTEIGTLKWRNHQETFKISNINRIYFICTLTREATAIQQFNAALKSPPWNPWYWLPSRNSCSCNPKSPESELTPTPAMHSHQPSTNLPRYLPCSFSIKKPSKSHSDHQSIVDLLTDDGVARRNVLKFLPTIPPDI